MTRFRPVALLLGLLVFCCLVWSFAAGRDGGRPELPQHSGADALPSPHAVVAADAPWGSERQAVEPATVERASSGSSTVVFRDRSSGSSLQGLEVHCAELQRDSDARLIIHTDPDGQIALDAGEWSFDAQSSGYSASVASYVLEPGSRSVVWLTRSVTIRVEVVGAGSVPVAGASVGLWRDARWDKAPRLTDDRGFAELGSLFLHGANRLGISADAHLPAVVSIDPSLAIDGLIRLRVELEAAQDSWTLIVHDPIGEPISGAEFSIAPFMGSTPPVRVGATGIDGRLLVHGTWMFEGYRWLVAGSAYPWRCEARPWRMTAAGAREVLLVVPRCAQGAFVVDGGTEGKLSWKVLEPERVKGRGAILLPAMVDDRRGNLVPATLPARWPVLVEALTDSRTVFTQKIEVEADGWQVDATIEPERVTRRVHLFSCSSPIVSVRVGDRRLFDASEDRAMVAGSHSVAVDVDCGPTSLAVRLADENEFAVIGRRGEQDATIKLQPPSSTAASFAVGTERGEPVADVVVRLMHLEATRRVQTESPEWTLMRTNNIYRLEVDADGLARHPLPPGSYEVTLEHLRDRVGVGQAWHPRGAQTIEVRPGDGVIVVETTRPRLVTVDLEGGRIPGVWQLFIGPYSAVQGGRSCRLWLDGASHQLRVLDLKGRELGSAVLPAGRDSTTVTVPVRAAASQAGSSR